MEIGCATNVRSAVYGCMAKNEPLLMAVAFSNLCSVQLQKCLTTMLSYISIHKTFAVCDSCLVLLVVFY